MYKQLGKNMFNFDHIVTQLRIGFVSFLMLSLAACAPTPEDGQGGVNNDPFETVNRGIFTFNEAVDTVLLEPVAQMYDHGMPEYGRERVDNVLTNLKRPVVFLNSVLQADPENAFSALWSFVLNSTLGVAGIFDFAGENSPLVVRNEDFGQTLGVWGFGPGSYLVLPILGPSNIRDAVGLVADTYSDPFNYLDDEIVITRTVVTAIEARADKLKLIDDIYETSLDPYATFRSGYTQRRQAEIDNK